MKKSKKYRRVNYLNTFGLVLSLLTAFSAKDRTVYGAALKMNIVRGAQMSFQAESGKQYQILTSTDIGSGEWLAFHDPIAGSGEVYTFNRDSDQTGTTFFMVEEIGAKLGAFTITDLEMAMVPIPAGTFVMGTPDDEDGRLDDEGPQTTVTISKPFWISKYEVSQEQYQELMGYNPSSFRNPGSNHPVERVTWSNGINFCIQLTRHERTAGNLSDDFEYRLPTEAQWEYACRAGTTTRFPHGDDPTYSQLDEYAWYSNNGGKETHPVGTKMPNPWGLHDMLGNVGEWCLNKASVQRSLPGGTLVDPAGPQTQTAGRTIRGGSWFLPAEASRSGFRFAPGRNGSDRIRDVGFRPVLVSVQ